MKKTKPTTSNEFVEDAVTDSLYKAVLKELRTNPDGTKKKETGRKRALPRETLHNFLFYLSMTGEYELSAESAGLPEKRRRKYMTESETFRAVASQAKCNVSLRSRISVAQAIMGRKPGYYKLIHPATKQPVYIEQKEITPNVNAAMWWLEKVDKIGTVELNDDPFKNPQLGAPRNAEEAALLEMILNKHYEWVKKKEQASS